MERARKIAEGMRIDAEKVCTETTAFIRERMDTLKREGVVMGLGGGLDSAVTATLCTRAVGAKKTTGLILKEEDSDRKELGDAVELAEGLGIETRIVEMTGQLKALGVYAMSPVLLKIPWPAKFAGTVTRKAQEFFREKTGETAFAASLVGLAGKEFQSQLRSGNASYRAKSRLRMLMIYLHAERENRLVVGSANRTQLAVGYYVKHGCERGADALPLGGLYKTQVREVAGHLGIAAKLIEKPSKPEVLAGITDEEAIGISYEKLDTILFGIDKGWGDGEIAEAADVEGKEVAYVRKLCAGSEHMREAYVARAWGAG
ncbi:MAG: NAD(+) synthase [Planctomycetota bacterium]